VHAGRHARSVDGQLRDHEQVEVVYGERLYRAGPDAGKRCRRSSLIVTKPPEGWNALVFRRRRIRFPPKDQEKQPPARRRRAPPDTGRVPREAVLRGLTEKPGRHERPDEFVASLPFPGQVQVFW
jgi:hypothetical protein